MGNPGAPFRTPHSAFHISFEQLQELASFVQIFDRRDSLAKLPQRRAAIIAKIEAVDAGIARILGGKARRGTAARQGARREARPARPPAEG